MKVNYTVLAVLCLVASVPFVVHLANRRSASVPVVRFATFNVEMYRKQPGALLGELRGGASAQARKIAEIVQRAQIDVLLLCELDRDDAAATAEVLAKEYFAVSQNKQEPIDFTFSWCGPVNTGEPTGLDLDRDGRTDGPGDAFGFGAFPGQYGMALLSRYPIQTDAVRTFRMLQWSAMPGALRPEGFYTDEAWAKLRLSSKSHWDVPLGVGTGAGRFVVHALCSHPTPPVYDGPEDRNGCRNHDEIRFWTDYLTPDKAGWITDDAGAAGGLPDGERFVILGDLNSDPADGDARRDALVALLAHPRVQDPQPRSAAAVEERKRQWGANATHAGDATDTADFEDEIGKGPGNLRVDYVLPARLLTVARCGVFWPRPYDAGGKLVDASDHRLVWVDVEVP
ncbi:MAG TPA: endonuclease/exonuclease/phosphatase family protein [Planctomycetota bacterium]